MVIFIYIDKAAYLTTKYLEFGAAHNSIGSVVILSNERPQQSAIMMAISTMITGTGCFAQKIPHLSKALKDKTCLYWCNLKNTPGYI